MLRYFGKYAKRISVTEPEESDFPNKRQRDGIGRKASVDVAIGGEASVTVDNKPLSALSVGANITVSTSLGGCPFHGRVERDEIPTRESPPKQSGTR